MTEEEFKQLFVDEFADRFISPIEFMKITNASTMTQSVRVGVNTKMGHRIVASAPTCMELLVKLRIEFAKEVKDGR